MKKWISLLIAVIMLMQTLCAAEASVSTADNVAYGKTVSLTGFYYDGTGQIFVVKKDAANRAVTNGELNDYQAFNEAFNVSAELDLGAVKSVDSLQLYRKWQYFAGVENYAANIKVRVSEDGENYTDLGDMTITDLTVSKDGKIKEQLLEMETANIKTRYIQFVDHNNHNGTLTAPAEIVVLEGGKNATAGKTAVITALKTESSETQEIETQELTDGNLENYKGVNGFFHMNVFVDLEEVKAIKRIRLWRQKTDLAVAQVGRLDVKLRVMCSVDNKDWVDVGMLQVEKSRQTGEDNYEQMMTLAVDNVQARYIKVIDYEPHNGTVWLPAEIMALEADETVIGFDSNGSYADKITDSVITARVMPKDGESGILLGGLFSDRKLIEAKLVPYNCANADLSFDLNDTEYDINSDKLEIRAFSWENLGTMTPLTGAQALSAKSNIIRPEFDVGTLFSVSPAIYPVRNDSSLENYDNIDALYYEGLPYKGKETRIYAYVGVPENASSDNRVPAVVLVHGGGGTAYPEWVKKWNDRGYAAIAMDLNGFNPQTMTQHNWAGPTHNGYEDCDLVEYEDQWMYHSVANVILANNILRSNPVIDGNRIGITGISWGGVITSTAIGIDNRFAFAAPIYGCGFLYESTPRWINSATKVKKTWDPSLYFTNANIPILWVNSDHDPHFSLHAATKSYLAAKNNSVLNIHPDLEHSESAGMNVEEVYAFADSVVKNEQEFIKIEDVWYRNNIGTIQLSLPEGVSVKRADLYTTSDSELRYRTPLYASPLETQWNPANNMCDIGTNTVTFEIPENTGMYYVNITDSNERTVCTGLIYNK